MNAKATIRLAVVSVVMGMGICNVVGQAANIVTNTEQEKWRYVQQEFLLLTGNAASFINTVGTGLSTYGALPIASVIGGVTIQIITALGIHGILFTNLSVEERFVASAAVGVSIIISVYAFCKLIGQWMESKNIVAQKVLQQYIAQWETHKAQTPEQLKDLFERLSIDLKQNGYFTKISQQQAQKIVEAVLAMSLIADLA